jgi:hypothetical protein
VSLLLPSRHARHRPVSGLLPASTVRLADRGTDAFRPRASPEAGRFVTDGDSSMFTRHASSA